MKISLKNQQSTVNSQQSTVNALSKTGKLACAIALLSLCCTLPVNSQIPATEIFNAPPPPPGLGAPGNRTAGGKRGCSVMTEQGDTSNEKQLTALVPVYGSANPQVVFGLTTLSHPTFWFYVPYVTTANAEFSLQNEAGETVYKKPVSLSGKPGIIKLSVPSTDFSLEIGKRYHWYLDVYCDRQQPPVYVDGWIKRVELNATAKNQLNKATLNQRAAIYNTNGIWYDYLTTSAELHRQDPKQNNWSKILQSIGLNNISSEPLVDCCK
ncbi:MULTISPECIES: DUF928 domain-containing protein [Calothrix]|uniref:DUF928 domain-containing protein n=2 Tax=Calothrix TaxID=1186 RepID=A0ABR8A9J7_9CYAN|nr:MULTISPECIES: DUF928 domain-containing protein [Calothrix]MBD2196558.1 DUF928 domain-containing protein [Calothrix parietina FACHB-288]MBD2227398.1 DUF928 domain-containing protein [Calothrix anomala FACHB-343]